VIVSFSRKVLHYKLSNVILAVVVKGSRPERTGFTRLPSGDTGGPMVALAILQGR